MRVNTSAVGFSILHGPLINKETCGPRNHKTRGYIVMVSLPFVKSNLIITPSSCRSFVQDPSRSLLRYTSALINRNHVLLCSKAKVNSVMIKVEFAKELFSFNLIFASFVDGDKLKNSVGVKKTELIVVFEIVMIVMLDTSFQIAYLSKFKSNPF